MLNTDVQQIQYMRITQDKNEHNIIENMLFHIS